MSRHSNRNIEDEIDELREENRLLRDQVNHNTNVLSGSSKQKRKSSRRSYYSNYSISVVAAFMLSYYVNHSLVWAVIHGLLGYIYIIFYILTRLLKFL